MGTIGNESGLLRPARLFGLSALAWHRGVRDVTLTRLTDFVRCDFRIAGVRGNLDLGETAVGIEFDQECVP